jgi:hypothetical protein
MSKTFLFVGDHAETLASGMHIAPGDAEIPASAVDPEADKRLLDERLLIEPAAQKGTRDKESSA